jgi:hypothetical protein
MECELVPAEKAAFALRLAAAWLSWVVQEHIDLVPLLDRELEIAVSEEPGVRGRLQLRLLQLRTGERFACCEQAWPKKPDIGWGSPNQDTQHEP